jgi:restriction endonuclease HindI-like protein
MIGIPLSDGRRPQAVQAVLAKRAPGDVRPEEDLDHAVRQIISRAVAPEGVVDIFAAAGLAKPDTSILSEEFLAEVRGMPQRNLAVELLQKLLKGELATRRRKNVVQARSFAGLLEQAIRRYQNRAIEAAQVIEELIALAKEMREANARGDVLGLSEDELAFCDALGTNDKCRQGSRGRDAASHRAGTGQDRPCQRHHRLDAAGERPCTAARAREADPSAVRLSARQAGEGDGNCTGAGGATSAESATI